MGKRSIGTRGSNSQNASKYRSNKIMGGGG